MNSHPSSAESIRIETALNDLAGCASIAAFALDAIRNNPEAAASPALDEGLAWLATRLNASAENALSVQRRRAPRWHTLADSEDIAEALAGATAAEENRRAELAAAGAEPLPF